MKRAGSILMILAMVGLVGGFFGCASSQPKDSSMAKEYSGFLKNYPTFEKGQGDIDKRYLKKGVDFGIELVAILRAQFSRGVVGVCQKLRRLGRLAEALPDAPAGRGDIDVPVFGLEHAGRNAGRMIVAGLFCHFAIDEIARSLEVEHEDLRLQQ